MPIVDLLLTGTLIVAFIAAVFFTGKAIYHMFHVVTNITGRFFYFFGPLLLVMPNMFNHIGNVHRLKLLKTFPFLLLSYTLCFGIKFYFEANGAL